MGSRIDELVSLYSAQGLRVYGGEPVSQLEHALQCAQLAEAAGADDELVLAALLHDVGHLVAGAQAAHEETGARYLHGLLPEAVVEPIRLHVDAKRFLCYAEPGYWESLSAESKRSLERQGGPFTGAGAKYFFEKPYAREAIALRRWDDLAKSPDRATRPLSYYVGKLRLTQSRLTSSA